MIRAIAIDDEPLGLKIVSHFCEKSDFIVLEKTFTIQSDALKYLKNYPVDLIFLDIQMPNKNGIEFYKALESNQMVIFTTAYSQFAVDAFNVSATDYLLKPFSEERFNEAILKARIEFKNRQSSDEQTHLTIRANQKLLRINYEEINLIEGLDDYIQIHLQDKSKIVTRFSMKNIIEKLPEKDFVRVHRSYIIPIKKIKALKNKNLIIEEFVIPIGEKYKNEILKLFK